MKSGNLILKTALLTAMVGMYGCSDGDETNINIDAPTFGGGGHPATAPFRRIVRTGLQLVRRMLTAMTFVSCPLRSSRIAP